MLETLRRVAVLTIVSAAGIGLLAPLATRSATPLRAETQQLLAAAEPMAATLPRGTTAGRDFSSSRALAPASLSAEVLGASVSRAPTVDAVAAAAVYLPIRTPAPVARARVVTFAGGSVWDRLAQCESSGNWAINTGNGYYGGLQFSIGTWDGYGGAAFAARPDLATREQQITVAERLRAARGYAPWPACRVKLGLP